MFLTYIPISVSQTFYTLHIWTILYAMESNGRNLDPTPHAVDLLQV